MIAHLYVFHSHWEIKHVTETLQRGLFFDFSYDVFYSEMTPPGQKH